MLAASRRARLLRDEAAFEDGVLCVGAFLGCDGAAVSDGEAANSGAAVGGAAGGRSLTGEFMTLDRSDAKLSEKPDVSEFPPRCSGGSGASTMASDVAAGRTGMATATLATFLGLGLPEALAEDIDGNDDGIDDGIDDAADGRSNGDVIVVACVLLLLPGCCPIRPNDVPKLIGRGCWRSGEQS